MKSDLQKVEAKQLAVGDLFKHLRDNKINSVVTAKDDNYIYYKHEGMAGYVKRDIKVWRVLPRSKAKLNVLKVSRLNPDGTSTPVGECDINSSEVLLPKLPEFDRTPLAHALKMLKREAWIHIGERNELNKRPDPRVDNAIEEAELIVDDLSIGIKALGRLQTLLKLQKNNQPLTHNQTIALDIILGTL